MVDHIVQEQGRAVGSPLAVPGYPGQEAGVPDEDTRRTVIGMPVLREGGQDGTRPESADHFHNGLPVRMLGADGSIG